LGRIVELIERDRLKPEETAYYRIPEGWDQQILKREDLEQLIKSHEEQDEGKKPSGRLAWAYRDREGILFIIMNTYDLGHYGAYGLAHASADVPESRIKGIVPNCGSATRLKRGWWAYERGD